MGSELTTESVPRERTRSKRTAPLLVMKFGGTSVGIAPHCEQALEIVRERAASDPIVVVSALNGVTNLLVELCRAKTGRDDLLDALAARHRAHSQDLGVREDTIATLLAELRADPAIAAEAPLPRADRDRVLAFGERIAASLFADALTARGAPARPVHAAEAGLVAGDHIWA